MPSPPKLAQALLALSIPADSREPILGDFAEEFTMRCQRQALNSAKLWYWKQAVLSFPYLIAARIKANPLLLQTLLLAMSYLMFLCWTALLFYLFRLVYTTNIFKGSVLLALSVRLLIECIGFAFFGALIHYGQKKFLPPTRKYNSLKYNFWPIFLILILLLVPTALTYFSTQHLMMKRYLLAKIIAIIPAVIFGAGAAQYFIRRTNK